MLIKPYFTEKSLQQADAGRYTFDVDTNTSKTQIKKAIEDLYKVNVTKVLTTTKKVPAKVSFARSRRYSAAHSTKKATVYLKSGQKLDIFKTK